MRVRAARYSDVFEERRSPCCARFRCHVDVDSNAVGDDRVPSHRNSGARRTIPTSFMLSHRSRARSAPLIRTFSSCSVQTRRRYKDRRRSNVFRQAPERLQAKAFDGQATRRTASSLERWTSCRDCEGRALPTPIARPDTSQSAAHHAR